MDNLNEFLVDDRVKNGYLLEGISYKFAGVRGVDRCGWGVLDCGGEYVVVRAYKEEGGEAVC